MGASLGIASSLIGIGGSLSGLFGGAPANNVQLPNIQPYANVAGTQQNVLGGTQDLSQWNVPAQLLPQYQQFTQNLTNSPYAGGAMTGAQQAGGLGQLAGLNQFNAGGQIGGNALSMQPDVQALLSMGFDPQNALYSRTQQQLQDQTRASEAARGIATTPYGAGLENKAMSDFNIDWQNQMLQRATQGAGAAGNLSGQIAQGAQTGYGMQAQAPQTYFQGAQLPYSTYGGINSGALSALGNYGQFGLSAAQLPQQQINDYLQYLGLANQNSGQQVQLGQLALNQANSGFQQNQIMGQNLGSSLAGLSKNLSGTNWFGGTSGGMGGLV